MYKISADGTSLTDLGYTTSSQIAALSPNGKKVAYAVGSVWWGGAGIRIRNVDGSGTSTDIHQPVPGSILGGITWATNTKIVYSFSENSSNDCYSYLVALNTDATGYTHLSPDNTGNPANTCPTQRHANVNPSTGEVVYTSINSHFDSHFYTNGTQILYTVNLDGTNNQVLFMPPTKTQPNGTITHGSADYPRWSSDGSNVALIYNDPNSAPSTADIAIITSGGTLNSVIGNSASNLTWPTPILTNNTILYSSTDGIHSIKSDGTSDTVLVSTAVVSGARNPMISPDRGTIYFQDINNSYEMYKASADGTVVTDLGYSTNGLFASLSPDGTKIAYLVGGIWWGGDAIRMRNVDGTGSTTDIHQSVQGNIMEVSWASNTKLVYSFENVDNNGVVGANDCYNFIVSMNTDETGFSYLSPDNTANTPNTCATPRHPSVDVASGVVAYANINPHYNPSSDNNGTQVLCTVNLNGTNDRTLFTPPNKTETNGTISHGSVDHPHWSTDGNSLVLNYFDPNNPTTTGVGIIDFSGGTLTLSFHLGALELAWSI